MGSARGVIYRRVLVTSIIAMLVFPMLGIKGHNFTIQERTQPIAQPEQLWNGFVKQEWQSFLEQGFLSHMGSLRSFLILSYNETKHRLFPTRPNNHYIWTPEFGYYPVDTIRCLNGDVLQHAAIKQHYQRAARRLRILQELLSHHGVALLVVTPPPKVRLYPEYAAPYLIAPAETIMSRAISYGDVLEESGVNVLNVQRIFAERKAASPWPFFTTTSFHWSFWAGCIVTDEIMRKAEGLTGRPFFSIDCSDVDYGKSKWMDTDIASILNIFSTGAIIGEAPFPKITPHPNTAAENRKIVIIGDSFSNQIVYALTQALPELSWMPDWLTLYPGFISRQTVGMNGEKTAPIPLRHDSVLSEILTKDMVILEVSDGNVYRNAGNLNDMEFGATRILLDRLLQETDKGVIHLNNFLVDGWRPLGNEQWRTTGHLATFAIRPPTNGNSIQLVLDVENKAPNQAKPRLLTILMDGQPIGQTKMTLGRGVVALPVPSTAQWQDSFLAEISLLEASGKPLDILLHGVRMVGAGADKAANKPTTTQATPLQKTPDNTRMSTINLFSNESRDDLTIEGLSSLESNDKENWRWALGPATRIKFYVDPAWPDQARQLLLKFAFKNGVPIPGQTVTIRLNGKDVYHFSAKEIGVQKQVDADVVLVTKKGVNVLEIVYQDWNHGKKNYAAHDSRQLAVVVMRLSLQGANK